MPVMLFPLLQIKLSDVIDILLVASMLYTASACLKQTRAAFIVRGLFIFVAVYIIARHFGLELTAWIFQGFFAISLIVIVVIFQEELRQIFERIALHSIPFRTPSPPRSDTADTLVRTIADLARDRIGALLVLRGADFIGRHITGGIEADAKISEPILKSIFDPHSAGHDGAVIIEGDRVSRFAAHLPLSKDLTQLAGFGTRHSAALGLAELTDALCLVVSEERGSVSVARTSRLISAVTVQELRLALQRFFDEKYPPAAQHWGFSMQFLRTNWRTKAATVILAIGLWYVLVPGSETTQATYQVPVALEHLPQNVSIKSVKPDHVQATFVGPKRAFYLFDPRKLKVTVDASLLSAGNRTIRISEQNIRFPNEIMLQDLTPSTLQVSASRDSTDNPTKG